MNNFDINSDIDLRLTYSMFPGMFESGVSRDDVFDIGNKIILVDKIDKSR